MADINKIQKQPASNFKTHIDAIAATAVEIINFHKFILQNSFLNISKSEKY